MKRSLIAVVIICLGLIVVGLVYWFGIYTKDLEIFIVFDTAGELGKDTKIVLNRVPVGEVRDVKTADGGEVVVAARIYKQHREKVNSSSAFIIESADSTAGPDKKQISVEVLNEDAPPLREGARVEGYSSRPQFFVSTSRKIFESAYDQFNDWLVEFQKGLKDLSEDDRLEELKKNMRKLMEETRKAVERGVEEFNKEAPRLKEELNRIIEELRRLGRDREADEFREQFDNYLKQSENRGKKARLAGISCCLCA
jgi:ABC-type transporter Mla subunit MlaD